LPDAVAEQVAWVAAVVAVYCLRTPLDEVMAEVVVADLKLPAVEEEEADEKPRLRCAVVAVAIRAPLSENPRDLRWPR
jgi:hypothetical protein